jgi:ElaA protein
VVIFMRVYLVVMAMSDSGTALVKTIQSACLTFDELTTSQLYDILKLRAQVFMGEQYITDPDVDGVDLTAHHVMLLAGDEQHSPLVGYCRLYQKVFNHQPVTGLGRIVIHPEYRGQQLGKQLVAEAVNVARQLFPEQGYYLSAQAHLQGFYEHCGFQRVSEETYLDAGIPHIDMVRK